MKYKEKTHYKLTSKEGEETIAYCYDLEGSLVFGFNIADGGGFLPVADLMDSAVIEEIIFSTVSPSEALFGFCAWLTTQKESTILGSEYNCSPVVERLEQFMESQGFEDCREEYTDYLKDYPKTKEPDTK